MTPDPPEHVDPRQNLVELEPDLRERLLALDEPVAWDDWDDAVRRSHVSRSWRGLGTFVAIVASAATAGALGLVIALQLVGGHGHGSPVAAGTNGQALSVSSTRQGGLCYRWPSGVRGCAQLTSTPLAVSWRNGRVVGAVSSAHISSITIEFTDGTFVHPAISWLAAPVNAGFFVYDIPAGKTVAAIDGLHAGRVSRQVTWFSV